jgi:predicted ribosome quality control (RQC) complex YloA/Tae2 family protein
MVKIYKSSEGNEIVVGENAKENDVIRKKSAQNDIWFHLENTSSPHVILRCGKNKPTKNELHECSQLVKFYSKLKDAPRVSVIYTQVKQVKKVPEIDGRVELRSSPEVMAVYDDDNTMEILNSNKVM